MFTTLGRLLIASVYFSFLAFTFASDTLSIYWIDSEGGGSTLVVTPAHESILIDSGNPGMRDARRIHQVLTAVAGEKQIDHLITTHFHIDHFGGAAELASLVPVGQVYDNGVPTRDPDRNPDSSGFLARIKPYIDFPAEKRHVVKAGDTVPLKQQGSKHLSLTVLAAQQKIFLHHVGSVTNTLCASGIEKASDTSDNANSIVLLLRYEKFRFFDGGDLTWNIERQLVCPENQIGEVDVFQVNHHGLDLSNNPLLIRSLAPTVAVLNNGPRKGAEKNTMETLRATPSIQAIYQLHKNLREGAHNASDHLIANVGEQCTANYIKLSFDPANDSYSISIPARQFLKSYKIK